MLAICSWALFGLIAVTNWGAVARQDHRTEAVVKPAALLALATVALVGGAGEHPAGWWLLAALLLGTVGDTFLLERGETRFLGGLAAFLVGHLAYIAGFLALGVSASWWAALGGLALLAALLAGRTVLPRGVDGPVPHLVVMVAYHLGQALIVAGFLTTL